MQWKNLWSSIANKKRVEQYVPILLSCLVLLLIVGITLFLQKRQTVTEYRVVCLGDSIIGNTRDETSVTSVMEKSLQEPVANVAFGGTCASMGNTEYRPTFYEDSMNLAELASSIVRRDFSVQFCDSTSIFFSLDYFREALEELSSIDFDKVEILFIEHGINDYNGGRPLDNPDDPLDVYTFGGALRYAVSSIQKRYPHLQIVLVTPLYCYFTENGVRTFDSETMDFGYGPLENYVNLELSIANEYGVMCVDNFHNLGINRENMEEYTIDGVHLNESGRLLLANALADFVKTLDGN